MCDGNETEITLSIEDQTARYMEKMETLLEKNPVEINYPEDWSLPVVFSSPHSGSYYPDSFLKQTCLDILSLRQSEDFLVDELFSAAPQCGAPLIKSNYPRAYCDPNRQAYELDPDMFNGPLPKQVITCSTRISAGIGTIPKVVSAGTNIYSSLLTFEEAVTRLNLCYFPYHAALKKLLADGVKKFGKILLIDCHSMPTFNTKRTRPRLADFILGDRYGSTCPSKYSAHIAKKLSSFGHSVAYNSPYAGGFITQHYGKMNKNIHALQIEVNRDLYMQQCSVTATDDMPELKRQLSEMIGNINTVF